ncbi:uncharacterized protein LOC122509412 isoform X2 [Leptopilina heterotoma]|nr:uncharacterized protein LOC122509412 isoform X2 [Leptopilina heterotoma]
MSDQESHNSSSEDAKTLEIKRLKRELKILKKQNAAKQSENTSSDEELNRYEAEKEDAFNEVKIVGAKII